MQGVLCASWFVSVTSSRASIVPLSYQSKVVVLVVVVVVVVVVAVVVVAGVAVVVVVVVVVVVAVAVVIVMVVVAVVVVAVAVGLYARVLPCARPHCGLDTKRYDPTLFLLPR